MRVRDLLEMSQQDIINIENEIKKSFITIDIIINFSKHFGDRISDGAVDEKGYKRDDVTPDELYAVFRKLKKHYKDIFQEAGNHNDEIKRGEFNGVIIDTFKKINIPFALDFDKSKGKYIITCKTVLKRANFLTRPKDHVIALRGK
jgi:hypothetical protein